MTDRVRNIFALSPDIRYVCLYQKGKLHSETAKNLKNASVSESDKYEELLVNPTLLFLAKQRGDIDCGGLNYLLIRYGNFFQYVRPVKMGHLSVCIEPNANYLDAVKALEDFVQKTEELRVELPTT